MLELDINLKLVLTFENGLKQDQSYQIIKIYNMIYGKNYIGNQQSAKGNKKYKTFNPQLNIDNEVAFVEATSEEIDNAVHLASEAFKSYRSISGEKKAAFLNAIADEILDLDDELIKIYCMESGLPEGRAKGERGRTVFQLRSFANLVKEGSWVGWAFGF